MNVVVRKSGALQILLNAICAAANGAKVALNLGRDVSTVVAGDVRKMVSATCALYHNAAHVITKYVKIVNIAAKLAIAYIVRNATMQILNRIYAVDVRSKAFNASRKW